MPGVYNETINYSGKNITVGSLTLTTGDTSYIKQTIIDGSQLWNSVVSFYGGENTSAILNGFTIQNGEAFFAGGGVYIGASTSPTITNLVIKENIAIGDFGPGLGSGIFCGPGSAPILTNLVVHDNGSIDAGGWELGGIYSAGSLASLRNVTAYNNGNYGIYCTGGTQLSITNSIIWGNTPSQIYCADSTQLSIHNSNISGGQDDIFGGSDAIVEWENNLNELPLFCSPDNGDFTLANNSPCVGTGENGANMGALGIGCEDISTDNLALRFDGIDDRVFVQDHENLDLDSAITIEAWVYPYDVSTDPGGCQRTIIRKGDVNNPVNYALSIDVCAGSGMIQFNGASSGVNALVDSVWQHVAGVYNLYEMDITIYVNGQLMTQTDVIAPLQTNNDSLTIGCTFHNNGGIEDMYWGIIDEIHIWNVARSQAEIQADMYRELSGYESGLVGYWPFNEGSDNSTFDISGNGNDGIINGAEWVLSDVPLMRADSITLIIVPDDQPTIQDAIDFADFIGDTVLVMPGTYVENINFSGKNITVGSLTLTTGDTSYIRQTIIDGDSSGSVVTFENGEDSTAVLNGFTIINGTGDPDEFYDFYGGGINCLSANPKIVNAIIVGNSAWYGGGISCRFNSNPNLSNVIITGNQAGDGGGIFCESSSPSLENVTITDNSASFVGGINCLYGFLTLKNVTISTNRSDNRGGILTFESDIIIQNSILWNNSPDQIVGEGNSNIIIEYSNSSGGLEAIIVTDNDTIEWGEGNINALPLFCNPDSGDFTLAENSPCIGAGEGGANIGAQGIGCGYISIDNLALRFDGHNDYVSFNENIITSTILTIEAWAKMDGRGGGDMELNSIFQQRDDETGDNRSAVVLTAENADGNVASTIRSNTGSADVVASPSPDYGEWHHYTVVVDTTALYLYLDGILLDSTTNTQTGDYTTSIDYIDIGRHSYSGLDQGFFDGLLDEIQIWNVARSQAVIQADMYRELSGDEPGLVGYWSFNEGAGETAQDYSANSNDGVISGAEWALSNIPMFGQDSITLIIVPNDQPTIQAGINFATQGDTVLVMPGHYIENIDFNGKNITVGSLTFTTDDTSYIKQTIIDGDSNGSVVTFANWEDSTAQLCGFSIVNGSGTILWGGGILGGGIYCINSSPTLSNLIISGNAADTGGGIYFNSSNSQIANCRIMDNLPSVGSFYGGGGICADNSDLILENLVFTNNVGIWSALISFSSNLTINSTSFIDTDTLDGSIFYCADSSNLHISNSILWNPGKPEISIGDAGNTLTVSHCNIEGGLDSIVVGENNVNWLAGNIDADPLYVNSVNGIYQLRPCSPCIGAGSNDFIPPVDIDGNPRPHPPGSQIDMGAYEHQLAFPRDIPEIQVTQFSMDFGEAFLNFNDTLIYKVSNWGCNVLYIFAETNLVEYVVEPDFIALEQGEKDSFLVIFTPIYCSNYPGTLTLTTNDADEDTITVALTGRGVLPPIISVYPIQYTLEMNLDLVETHTSVISNNGGSDLVFEIAMDEPTQQGGYALQFDGIDDYVNCGDLGFESGDDSVTVAMWIKPNTTSANYCYWEFPGGMAHFALNIQDGNYLVSIAGAQHSVIAEPAGEWVHLAVTYDGLSVMLYLNDHGLFNLSVDEPVAFDISGRPFLVGTSVNSTAFVDGAIDAVMVWSAVRSQAEINSDMHRTVAYDEPGLVGYWRFNEGIGDTTSSYTIVNRTGMIYGAPEWIESTAPITRWITVQPLSGTIESSGSEDITITLDASNLLVGDYQTELQLFSNDPDHGLITIPVILTTVVSVVDEPVVPTVFKLHQNYPNPFNPVTTIRYDLPQDSRVELTIYDILGRQVISLADDYQNAGYKSIRWNGHNASGKPVSAGMYFYAVKAGRYSAIRKMVLLK